MKNNWQTKKLYEICEELFAGGDVPKESLSKAKTNKFNIPIFSNGEKNKGLYGYTNIKRVTKPSITISARGTIGYSEVRKESFYPAVRLIVVTPKTDIVDLYFLKYALDMLNFIKSGSSIPQLTIPMIKEYSVQFPSLPEQKRIVKILDETFEKLEKVKENTKKNLQNSKEFFESYLNNIFSNPKKDWEEKTLGDIGKPSMCKRILKNQTSSSGEIPFYKIGTFGKEPNSFISKEIYNEFRTKYSFPKKGDILVSASGTIGRHVRYDGKPAFFQDSNIVWIDNDEKQVLNDYLYIYYEFCNWQPSKGATIARLYNNNFTSMKIVFPRSMAEQKVIIKKIDGLLEKTKRLEEIYKNKLEDIEELKKTILNKAFGGKL